MIFILIWKLGSVYSQSLSRHIATQHIQLHLKESGCLKYRKCGQLQWKTFLNHNVSAQSNIFFAERTKNFHDCPHIQPQSPGCLLHSDLPPVCPFFPTLSPPSPLALPSSFTLCFFHLVSCTSSVFKVQSTKAGCLSPEAVIDRLTKRETEKRDERAVQGGRVSQGRQRRRLESLSEPEGLFLSVSMRHYWAEDTQDTWDEMTNS